MAAHEHTVNVALAEVLRGTRRLWSVDASVIRAEVVGAFEGNANRPDIVVAEPETSPVIVETEVSPAPTVEADALARLGELVRDSGQRVLSSVAVRIPAAVVGKEGAALRSELAAATFEMAMFSGADATRATRWPSSGWISGALADLSILVQSASIPQEVVERAVDALVAGVQRAAALLAGLGHGHAGLLQRAANELHQASDEQTRRMIATILTNAFVFHEVLAGGRDKLADVATLDDLVSRDGALSRQNVLVEWRKILTVDYWPIFDIARRLLQTLPATGCGPFLTDLHRTASNLLTNRLMRSHDLTGAVFQRLIADRKFLAAYYTTPAAAALLVGLAVSKSSPPDGGSWSSYEDVTRMRVADFACGTGTLLSTAYRRIGELHELAGGDMEIAHPAMMSRCIVGCDILPAAAHLTASMLSGIHPAVQYDDSCIFNVGFGRQADDGVALGSLDILDKQTRLEIVSITARAFTGQGAITGDVFAALQPRSCDLVIMNPPFTRDTNHEGARAGVVNPAFAAFGTDDRTQKQMSVRLKELTKETCAHGNAGEASAFVALADRQLKPGGELALVLPLSALGGSAWGGVRQLLQSSYGDLRIGSIAGATDQDSAFSADTGMAEALIAGRKTEQPSVRALFFTLSRRPSNPLEGSWIAREICSLSASVALRRLEDGPFGGTPICTGSDQVGELLDCPLIGDQPWLLNRIADVSLAQCAYQIAEVGALWLPGQSSAVADLPICQIQTLGSVGPIDRDINEATLSKAKIPRGPFEICSIPPGFAPTFPALWAHEASRERSLAVLPDRHGLVRKGQTKEADVEIGKKADQVWKTASRIHVNRDFRFNSQALSFCLTPHRTLGGRAWPSVIVHGDWEKALVLWANSTLGLLLHWWQASKVQAGRGSLTNSMIPTMRVLDVRTLSKSALEAANTAFDELAAEELLPAHKLDRDPIRAKLDEVVLVKILGLSPSLLEQDGLLDRLRRKLAAEPSMKGAKRAA